MRMRQRRALPSKPPTKDGSVDRPENQNLAAVLLILAIAAGVSWAGSQHGVWVASLPVFAWCGILSFAVNWVAFVHAYRAQSERYFDLTGSVSYVSVVALALVLSGATDPRSLLLGALIGVWAARLGSFLFARIRRDGKDGRFDAIKTSVSRFFLAWTLQGLWVFLTLACALAAMTSSHSAPLGGLAFLGTAVWVAGFGIEVVADREKRRFRDRPENRGRFIQTGLWAWSRHPNYFGEITLWLGVALIALPALSGWQLVTLISPVFVLVLLTRISGIPPLEARAEEAWGNDPAYRAYRDNTPALVLRPPRST